MEYKSDILLDVPTKRVLHQHSGIILAAAEQVLDSKMRIRFEWFVRTLIAA
jgi:hypothetical protein